MWLDALGCYWSNLKWDYGLPNWLMLAETGMAMDMDIQVGMWPDRGPVVMEWLWLGCQYILGYDTSPSFEA